MKNKKLQNKSFRVLMWYLQESNQGHTDFQSVALPTELRYHLYNGFALIRISNFTKLKILNYTFKAGANINLFYHPQNKNIKLYQSFFVFIVISFLKIAYNSVID